MLTNKQKRNYEFIKFEQLINICQSGNYDDVITFLNTNKGFDIRINDYQILKMVCDYGYCNIFIYMHDYLKNNNMVHDIHYDNECYLRLSALSQCIDLMDFLHQYNPDIRTMDDIIFTTACNLNHKIVIDWLATKCSDYVIDTDDGMYYIKTDAKVHLFTIDDNILNRHIFDNNEKIKVWNIDDVNKMIVLCEKNLVESTYYNIKKDTTIFDQSIRKSLISTKKVKLKIENIMKLNETIIMCESFDYIKYNPGGYFVKHIDTPKYVNGRKHNHTVIICPPQDLVGGEFIIYDSLDDSLTNIAIKPAKHNWTIIIFPVGSFHCSTEVIVGSKIILKSSCYIEQKKQSRDSLTCDDPVADNFVSHHYDYGNTNEDDDYDDDICDTSFSFFHNDY